MMINYTHQIGDHVRVTASPNSGDGAYNGKTGIVVGHEPDWDDDRTWPEVVVQFAHFPKGRTRTILDYNLTKETA